MRTRDSKPYTDRPFSLSPLAAVLFLVAAGLLTLGIRRSELASLLWGGTFLTLFLFAFLAVLLQGALLSGASKIAIEASLEPGWLHVGEEVRLLVTGEVRAARVPGVRLVYRGHLSWRGFRELTLSSVIPRRNLERRGEPSVPPRGVFRPVGARLVVTDALGFFRMSRRAPEPGGVTVAPRTKAVPLSAVISYREGEEPQRSDRRIRTEELLEVRRYVPGDDVRRINWKQYARWEELFLRIGEEVPPAAQEVTLVLRAAGSLREVLPEDFALSVLDRAVTIFGNLAESFHAEGLSVRYVVNDNEVSEPLDSPDSPSFRRHLADAGWTVGRVAPGSLRGSRMVVVALPDPGLGAYLLELGRTSASATLLLVDAPRAPGKKRKLPWLLRSHPADSGRPDSASAKSGAVDRYKTLVESAIVGLDGKVTKFHRV